MLKTMAVTANKKTGPIAVTYRSGQHETYATCPKSCNMHPKSATGADTIDAEYMQAVSDAVPRRGKAWTYSHFAAEALPFPRPGKTVFNASCDDMREAVRTVELGRPAVYAAAVGETVPKRFLGVRFVQCPAEIRDGFTCRDCGDGDPICARGDRDFVVVFNAHGTGAKLVGQPGDGGCYAASGPVAIVWHNTKKAEPENDGVKLRRFARALPTGSLLRHHVAGDIGRDNPA